ncbi:MAG: hypothetical protein GX591_07160 [Planctomycetes bacterium]|nr:hypothetical protein [Planctomycetota bacterium]
MARRASSRTSTTFPLVAPVIGGVLAWAVPGAGHWFLGRKVRAVILFVAITALFWSGVAIGGVFTVDPREQAWWSRAQMCAGLSGVVSYYRQDHRYRMYEAQVISGPPSGPSLDAAVRAKIADAGLALVAPASTLAFVFSGVAGLLNLLCIMDVVLLGAMGVRGEPPPDEDTGQEAAS